MTASRPLTIVIRLPDVALSRSDLEAALGLQLSRYEPSRNEPSTGLAYAQIDVADHGDQWATALDTVQSIGAIIPKLLSAGSIGKPSLDVAMTFPHSWMSNSLVVPAVLAAATGAAGIDIEVSVYKTD